MSYEDHWFTPRTASRASKMRKKPTRLRLTTKDLAAIFQVKPNTIRQWLSNKKLCLTGDAVKDFITISNLYQQYIEQDRHTIIP